MARILESRGLEEDVGNVQDVQSVRIEPLEQLEQFERPVTQDIPTGMVTSVNISSKKGMRKKPVSSVNLVSDYGIEGDAHARLPHQRKDNSGGQAGNWHRQVSLLAEESIIKMQQLGLSVTSGDFAENITTKGIDICSLEIGAQLQLGANVLLEISQIGKVCYEKCAIYYQAGTCIMPKEGVFAKVLEGGEIKAGDQIKVLRKERMR